ncbi:MAG: hypothetical protein E6Q85_00525 [Thiothrix sp.]|nr:MAG: hypothetical protein E6Q85_00525 [Thiothrix sp.]
MLKKEVTEQMFNELMERNKELLFLKACETFIRNAEFTYEPHLQNMIDELNQEEMIDALDDILDILKAKSDLLEDRLACEYKKLDIGPIIQELNI